MTTLRDVAARVAAEIRFRAAMFNHVELERTALRRWATELDAALKADTEAVCEWTEMDFGREHNTGCGQQTSAIPGRYCKFCGTKVKVNP
jgi:hypothetical protein